MCPVLRICVAMNCFKWSLSIGNNLKISHFVLGISSETSPWMSLSNTKIYFLLVTPYRFPILNMLIFRTQVDNFLWKYIHIHVPPFPTSLIHQSTFTSTVVHSLCAPVSQDVLPMAVHLHAFIIETKGVSHVHVCKKEICALYIFNYRTV